MAVERFFSPNDTVRWQSPTNAIKFGDMKYTVYLTDTRLLVYGTKGLIFKNETCHMEEIPDITDLNYRDEGMVFKKGILTVTTRNKKMLFEGKPNDITAMWQELQRYTKTR